MLKEDTGVVCVYFFSEVRFSVRNEKKLNIDLPLCA